MKKYILLCIVLMIYGCKKTYNPGVVDGNVNYLVVEGFINFSGEYTDIKLSRTTNLKAIQSKPELGAILNIESEDKQFYNLSEMGQGNYTTYFFVDPNKKYRLNIKTVKGGLYQSEFVQPKVSPQIDKINAEIKLNGVQISVDSHDDTNNSRYYRFEYEQTWRFHTKYISQLILKNGMILPRSANEDIYYCYGSDYSSNILIASTAQLSNDILSHFPVTFIPSGDERISLKYSILLKQYAMSEQEYKYWETLKKNTENIGSIFDPQPSFVSGNIHCLTNSEEKVLGYVGAGNITRKRIFLDKSELPETWKKDDIYSCQLDSLPESVLPQFLYPTNYVLVYKDGFTGISYASDIKCVDCTTRGTKTKPSFWP
ncbi:MAG: DUF4249 domain-containing protein [Candidatus Pedobacter colombiensis]|uniref:DUF4249 domain-containing protein n=1 Tax=Candidatus Pedobacter colombiensis TaxID=3121371 RepID=A0AAJ6B605_9SPHI|nr:DUF4249 domain-containing protein [Pedobacter sp.]WEK19337.1 MAG: DUF4249 domain-containing protein [Pedobacter sp.]